MVGAGLLHIGGAERDRTVDLLHAMQALSQLSYSPTRAWPAIITPAFEEASNEGPMARGGDREPAGSGKHRPLADPAPAAGRTLGARASGR